MRKELVDWASDYVIYEIIGDGVHSEAKCTYQLHKTNVFNGSYDDPPSCDVEIDAEFEWEHFNNAPSKETINELEDWIISTIE